MPPNIKHLDALVSEITSTEDDVAEAEASTVHPASMLEEEDDDDGDEPWEPCPASQKSIRTINPIRAIVDPIVSNSIKSGQVRGDGKDQISLALGDPTGYFAPCPAVVETLHCATRTDGNIAAGYVNALGTPEARSAIAKYHSSSSSSSSSSGVVQQQVSPDDVIVASGCSGALELALTALLDVGSVLLVPRPGFPLYQVIAESHGARVLHYDLLPDQGWECDLRHMERIIVQAETSSSSSTDPVHSKMNGGATNKKKRSRVVRGIVITNPSNPTGSVYAKRHLREIISLAKKYRLPLIADEIYGDLVYNNNTNHGGGATTTTTNAFHPVAEISAAMGRDVPVIAASGLGKMFLVPGWRVGWVVFHDSRHGALREVAAGAKRLAQIALGASHIAQRAVPAVLDPPLGPAKLAVDQWRDELRSSLEIRAECAYQEVCRCHGLSASKPQGAMYLMVKVHAAMFDETVGSSDVHFAQALLDEENVFVLPGSAFGLNGHRGDDDDDDGAFFFRAVFCAPEEVLAEAFGRVGSFCERHARRREGWMDAGGTSVSAPEGDH